MEFKYIEDDRQEEFGKHSYVPDYSISTEDSQGAMAERYRDIFDNVIYTYLEDLEEGFTVEDVKESLRPPYNSREINGALEEGVKKGDLEETSNGYRLI